MSDYPAPTDRQILVMESKTFRYSGAKERAIAETLHITAVHYTQRLLTIVADPDPALAVEFPGLIARLRRRVERGQRAKAARRAA